MLLHVVIPAYGESPFLRRAISSVIASVGPETPITVLDDASETTDVRDIANSFASRVSYLRNESNLGLASNFFHAFQVSDGDFTVVMGSDDEMIEGYEDVIAESLREFPEATLLMPNVLVIDAHGKAVFPLVDRIKRRIRGKLLVNRLMGSTELINKLFIGNFLYFPAIAWKTNVLLETRWNKEYRHAVDLDLLFNLAIDQHNLVLAKKEAFRYRRHSQSVSSLLAQEETRLTEELSVHKTALHNLDGTKSYKTVLLANLALTIRLHGIIIGIKQIPRNPAKGFRHITRSMRRLQNQSAK